MLQIHVWNPECTTGRRAYSFIDSNLMSFIRTFAKT